MQHFSRGLIAATHTPMAADGKVDVAPIERLAARLRRDGVRGVFPCGTTGEFSSLSLGERRRIVECWAAFAAPDFDVIVHVGSGCVDEGRELAEHAQKVGATAISCVAPSYLRPASISDLTTFLRGIAAAAPELPFYYYHIPPLTRVDLPMREWLVSASEQIPTLAGIKFSHLDLFDLGQVLELARGRFDIFYGSDETLLAGLAFGVDGAVGSTYNFAAPLYRRIVDAHTAGDLETARREQVKSQRMVDVFLRYGIVAAMKAAMRAIGLDMGPARIPLAALDEPAYESLVADLEAIGFFEFCSPAD